MKTAVIVGSIAVVVVSIALVLTNLATSDIVEPITFTDTPTATVPAGSVTAAPTGTAQPSPTPAPSIPAAKTFFPPLQLEIDAGQTARFILADGTSRNIKLLGTDLVYAHGTVTVWATATVEVSGPGIETVVKEIPAAYFHAPTIIHNVRIWVDITKEFNDRRLRDGGGTQHDARLVLSDARLPLTDPAKFVWPFPDLTWQAGSNMTYWQGLQGSLVDAYHHGAIDMGMPENTPVHAWTDGTFQATDRGFDWMVTLANTGAGLRNDITILHLRETAVEKNDTVVEAGEFLGLSGEANWFHSHLIYGYELSYMLAEWYMRSASPQQLSYVKDWLVAGPFRNENDALRLSTDYLGNEAQVAPDHGAPAAAGVQWKFWDNLVPGVVMVAETINPFPFSGWAHLNDNEPTGAAYMVTYVNSPDQRTAILNVGASDGIKVWVGDQEVLNQDRCIPGEIITDTGRTPTINLDEFKTPVTLQAGWNRILVKTAQKNGCPYSWQVSLRISDESGAPMNDLVVDAMRGAEPPEPQARPAALPDSGTSGPTPNTDNPAVSPTAAPTATASPSLTPLPEGSLLPSQSPPGGLQPSQIPMFVVIGSDDNNRAGGMEFFINAFDGRTNPEGSGNSATYDGDPALMSFYLIGSDIYGPNIDAQEWRDQYMAAYHAGHELGNHGFYGLAGDAPRGTVENWLNNWIKPTHDAMVRMGVDPDDIKGYRAAQDAIDPALYEALGLMGYEYSNSTTTNDSSNLPAWFPGTLDDGWHGGPVWDHREIGNHPGFWTVPQTYATGSSAYCDKDWFLPPANQTGADWREDMQATFLELYNGNRAPLSICIHSQEWGPTNVMAAGGEAEMTPQIQERQEAFNDFLDWLLSGEFPEVRIVTHAQLIEWMKNPTPLSPAPSPTPTPVALSQFSNHGAPVPVSLAAARPQDEAPRESAMVSVSCADGANGQDAPVNAHLPAAVLTTYRSSFARRPTK